MSQIKYITAISVLTLLMAATAACTSSSEAVETSDQIAVVQDGDNASGTKPPARTPAERPENKPASDLRHLAAIPAPQRTVGQDFTLATLFAAGGQNYRAFEALASAVNKGFSDVDKLENDKALQSLHADSKWAQVLLFTKDNKASGRKITPPQPARGPRAQPQRRSQLQSRVDVPSPDWTMKDINGNLVQLSDLRGKIVVLDFWATWCGPCRRIMPVIDRFVRDQKSDDVVVFSVNVWERQQGVALPWWKQQNYSMTLLFGDRSLTAAYGVRAIPHIVVIDANGIIRHSGAGGYPDLKGWTDQARAKS